MHETDAELTELQRQLDASFEGAGKHLRQIFATRLSAAELLAKLDGIFEMHLAVVTSDGRPLVAPIDAVMFQGKVWFGLPGSAVRATLVRGNNNVSASYTDASFALVVHGGAHQLDRATPVAAAYFEHVRNLYIAQYGPQWDSWHAHLQNQPDAANEFTGWIEPRRIFAKA